MATSRFGAANEYEIERLVEACDSKNTKSVINYAMRILKDFLECRGTDLDTITSEVELSSTLRDFYASARNRKGELYSKKNMLSIRNGIQKSFDKTRNIDIVNGEQFKSANTVFNAMLKKLKQEGKGNVEHKQPISKEDMELLYRYLDEVQDTPAGLQNKVFIDFMLYFCNRGRENLRQLKKDDFKLCGSGTNNHIELKDMKTKNHTGDSKDDATSQGGRMYGIPTNSRCPIRSFVKYYTHLNPKSDLFWQRPKLQIIPGCDAWYDNMAVGMNSLGNKMKSLSHLARLSTVYTNHCLRATAVTILDREGFEARHIMSVSGHKSENSIRSYARTDDDHKQRMATVISKAVTADEDSIVKKMKLDHPTPVGIQKKTSFAVGSAEQIMDTFDTDLSDADLLQLTLSQERQLLAEIRDDSNITPAATKGSDVVPPPTQEFLHSSNQTVGLSYRKTQPVFNFTNVGAVHVHYH